MKLIYLSLLLMFAPTVFAQMQYQVPSTYAQALNKSFMVDDFDINPKGIKLKVRGEYRGEPAGTPVYLEVRIKCGKQQRPKTIDLGSKLWNRYGKKVAPYLGGATEKYPNGVVHVCSLENATFDEHSIYISVLGPGPNGCDASNFTDFILPIEEFCSR